MDDLTPTLLSRLPTSTDSIGGLKNVLNITHTC